MVSSKKTSDSRTSKAKKTSSVNRLVSKRVITKLDQKLNGLISKEKRLLSKIADNRNEISEMMKSDAPVVSGIRLLENENLVKEIELDKVHKKISETETSLIGKLDKNDSILRLRRTSQK